MTRNPKTRPASAPTGWGELNVALNGLVKERVILRYSTGTAGKDATPTIEATIDTGADQADVVRRVREVLPETYAAAQVRTKVA